MPSRHSIRSALAALAALVPLSAAAQQTRPAPPATSAPSESTFTVFVKAVPVGNELISVTRDASGWTIASSGRLNAPLDVVTRQLTIRYDPNWKPIDLTLESTVRGQNQTLRTTMSGKTATSEMGAGGQSQTVATMTDGDILLPNLQFAAYEALTARLRTAAPGTTLFAFAPVAEVTQSIRVGESTAERIQTPAETIEATHTRVTLTPLTAGAPAVELELWADPAGRLLRLSAPAQALDVVREDIASTATRQVPISRPNDEQVRIPSNGFSLAATLSKPAAGTAVRLPAVLLVGGSGPTDRDELVYGIPVFGQLADAIADAGFVVLRYDKRGVGQSGGRAEAATLGDYADDARAAVKFLTERKDVDPKRIAVIGHSEGGSVAMLVGAKDKRVAALALVAAIGVTGAEVNMEQVKHVLDRAGRSDADKQKTLELQKKIQQAVLTGSGWEPVAAYRAQADTPWFQSFLAFDPAKIMPDIRQPVLVVHGELDTQVAPANADRLRALADARKNRAAVQVVKVPGVNHLLVPAVTGEIDEYATLKDRHVSPEVSKPIVVWLQATLGK